MDTAQYVRTNELRIILIGKTGSGKSRTGNSILGERKFDFSPFAKSKTGGCQLESTERFEKIINVIDTPGLCDNVLDPSVLEKEILDSIVKASPGPHAILVILKACRITNEDILTLQKYLGYFGKELYKFATVIFTHIDEMETSYRDSGGAGDSITDYINSLPGYLKEFLEKCENRYVFINNRTKLNENITQIENLLKICLSHGGDYYVDKKYETVNEEIENVLIQSLSHSENNKDAYEERDRLKKNESFLRLIYSLLKEVQTTFIRVLQDLRMM